MPAVARAVKKTKRGGQPKLTKSQVRAILDSIDYKDRYFHLGVDGNCFYLQVRYRDEDVDDPLRGKVEQRGRKWRISAFSTRSEIVRTAFKAVITSAEHQVREHFTYRGSRVFGPHIDVDALVEVCERTDRRKPIAE